MKKLTQAFLAACALSISSLSSAAAVYTFEGKLTDLWATNDQLTHYADTGISLDGNVKFKVLLDFSRQGQQTNTDGSTTVFQDIPVTPNCEECSASHANWYDYAELIYSSIDLSSDLPANRPYKNSAESTRADSQNGPHDFGAIRLGHDLVIGSGDLSGWSSAYIFNWDLTTSHYYYDLSFSLDDGIGGKIQGLSLEMRLVSINEIPVPAAAWLMGSGLMALGGIARRRAQQD